MQEMVRIRTIVPTQVSQFRSFLRKHWTRTFSLVSFTPGQNCPRTHTYSSPEHVFFIQSLYHLWDKSATSMQLPDRKFNISTLTKFVTSCPLDRIVPNREYLCPSFTENKKSFPQEAQRTPNQPFLGYRTLIACCHAAFVVSPNITLEQEGQWPFLHIRH